ncbi:MAG TPA: class I SAM-dependent methyltransferase [Burkholderiaceae bacterium]
MDWTSGYPSDIEYTVGFYREQSPAFLNFVCLLNGYEPVALHKPFTYFELGFGRGLTANILAAANPHGQFYAADFNPAHVAGARHLADSAGLSNLTLLENSFEDVAQGKTDLPQFDFITLHGIYSWITEENRQHIVDFIARYLKPGGVAYISYNAQPGWSAVGPLQRLLYEHSAMQPGRSDDRLAAAAAYTQQMEAAGARYFEANPTLRSRLDMLKSGRSNYLVHEYLHKHWQPLFHVDVARELAAAKLDYIGSAELPMTYPALYLTPPQQELAAQIPDASMRETVKDYFLNTQFRRDVFVRGARRVNPARARDLLSQTGLALIVPRAEVKLSLRLGSAQIEGTPELYDPVLDALQQGPHTLAQLAALPALAGQSMQTLAQIAALLTASSQAMVYIDTPGVALEPAQKMNAALAAQVQYGDEFQSLASPLLGNGLSEGMMARLCYLLLTQDGKADARALAKRAYQIMQRQGRVLNKDGKPLASEADNVAELRGHMERVLETRLPLWRQLKMI